MGLDFERDIKILPEDIEIQDRLASPSPWTNTCPS